MPREEKQEFSVQSHWVDETKFPDTGKEAGRRMNHLGIVRNPWGLHRNPQVVKFLNIFRLIKVL
jgi:hypothetical protein